jgi:sigma-B regulation protein RsbU (phosphoserine phosphatase)
VQSVRWKNLFSPVSFGLFVTGVVFVAAAYLYNIYSWRQYPDFGFGFRTATGIEIIGTVSETGQKAGLKVGDQIVEVNGKRYKSIQEFRSHMRRELGQENTYLIDRQGRRFAVTIKNIRIGFKTAFLKSGILYAIGLCYAFIGTIVFLMKPHRRTSWIFLLFTGTLGIWMFFLYKIGIMTPFWLETIQIMAYTFMPAVFLHMTLSFPLERNIIQKHPTLQLIPYALSTVLFYTIRSATPAITDAPKALMVILVIYMAIAILMYLASHFQLMLASQSELVKVRAKLILLGSAIATLIPLIDFISSTFFKRYLLPDFNFYAPLFIVFPLFIAYSIVKHDLFDIDAIIKRTYGYVLTTGALAGIYGLFVLMSNLAFGGFEFAGSPVFPLIFILVMVFLFNPIRNRAQRIIDRVFYRLEYDYQQVVERISDSLRTILGLEQIGQSIMDNSMGVMFVDTGSVLVHNKSKNLYEFLVRCGERDVQRTAESSMMESARSPQKDVRDDDTCEIAADPSASPHLSEFSLDVCNPLIQNIAEQKKEITVYDIQEDPIFAPERDDCLRTLERLDATLLVPMLFDDRLTGVIALGRKKSGKFYRQEDINLLHVLANQGAIAIENARMVDEVVEKERMEEELSIARDLQLSMLPVDCPQVYGFDIAAVSMSAREVGGDFYDFIQMDGDRIGMVIGDVTGKSVSGALVMSASRSVFRMLSEENRSVAESMRRANRRIKKDVKTGMFVALLYAVLDAQDRSLTLCSAGQTQPVYRSIETGQAVLMETRGDTFPLGILADVDYDETRVHLVPGDVVVLFTDGIVEAMNERQEIFGFERLMELVEASAAASAEDLLHEIIDRVSAHVGSAPQHDDLTVIVLRAQPPTSAGYGK